jgi:RHS repeat-associated protein
VAFASSTPAVCTVSGATATLVAAGNCTLTASQAGDSNYNAATSVPRTFTVNKAAQTITFATISTKTLIQTPLALSATVSSGLTVDFSSTTPAVCTVAGATATLLTTGTCSIAANQAGDSYWAAATQVLRSFSVTKASQTITFATLSNRTYSPTPFTVTGTASSGLTVAFAGTTPTICTVATDGGGVTTVTMLAAGTCTVTANQAGDATYNAATQVSRSFTISKASQTLTVDTIANKNVGDADFQPDVTNSAGLPYTLSTTTTAVCTVANNAVTIVATGTCTVKADAAATPAYNAATQQSKSFTVAAARAPIVYYVHPDQIGSPRAITKASDNSVVWRWDNEEAFGDNLPNEKPGGTGERFKYDLRFAGQVYDRETATSYNYFRDYSPAIGSYLQSDPLGLEVGINLYSYVDQNPTDGTDVYGLQRRGTSPQSSYNQTYVNNSINNLLSQIRQYQPSFRYSTVSRPGQGFNASNVTQLQGVLARLRASQSCPINDVIAETMSGRQNILSRNTLTTDQLLSAGEQFLGPNYRELGAPGSGVFRSSDGTRQFRIDNNSILGNHSPGVPHGHFEIFRPSNPRPDVNNHVPFN